MTSSCVSDPCACPSRTRRLQSSAGHHPAGAPIGDSLIGTISISTPIERASVSLTSHRRRLARFVVSFSDVSFSQQLRVRRARIADHRSFLRRDRAPDSSDRRCVRRGLAARRTTSDRRPSASVSSTAKRCNSSAASGSAASIASCSVAASAQRVERGEVHLVGEQHVVRADRRRLRPMDRRRVSASTSGPHAADAVRRGRRGCTDGRIGGSHCDRGAAAGRGRDGTGRRLHHVLVAHELVRDARARRVERGLGGPRPALRCARSARAEHPLDAESEERTSVDRPPRERGRVDGRQVGRIAPGGQVAPRRCRARSAAPTRRSARPPPGRRRRRRTRAPPAGRTSCSMRKCSSASAVPQVATARGTPAAREADHVGVALAHDDLAGAARRRPSPS